MDHPFNAQLFGRANPALGEGIEIGTFSGKPNWFHTDVLENPSKRMREAWRSVMDEILVAVEESIEAFEAPRSESVYPVELLGFLAAGMAKTISTQEKIRSRFGLSQLTKYSRRMSLARIVDDSKQAWISWTILSPP